MWTKQFFYFFLSTIFPPICLVCKKRGKIICQKCFENIQINNGFYCPQCHRRLPEPKNTCHPQVKFILAAASSYQNQAVRKLIHALKYQNIKQTVEPLIQILRIYLEKIELTDWLKNQNFIIIPIPLHPKKEKERGFNQTLLLAKNLRQYSEVGLPIMEKSTLIKIKNTPSQTEIKEFEKRAENAEGSFKIQNPELIAGKNILLFDDVFTSGATMKEAVKVLKKARAKKIIGVVIAKT